MAGRDFGTPSVSVVIPAYCASEDIPDALNSVFAQTYRDFEVIVINDGSPDTDRLEMAIQPYRNRICYLTQPNRGAGAARNAGIRQSRGRYVAFLDADDCWASNFLERQVSFLESRRDCGLVYADTFISGDSPLSGEHFMQSAPSKGEVTLLSLIQQRCNIPLSTVVMRREPLLAAGMFDESIRRGQDFDLWLRLADRNLGMAYQRDVLAVRRVRTAGLSGDAITQLERPRNVLRQFAQKRTLAAPLQAALDAQVEWLTDRLAVEQAKQELLDGRFRQALDYLRGVEQPSIKVRCATAILAVAPCLTRRLYLTWRRPVASVHSV